MVCQAHYSPSEQWKTVRFKIINNIRIVYISVAEVSVLRFDFEGRCYGHVKHI